MKSTRHIAPFLVSVSQVVDQSMLQGDPSSIEAAQELPQASVRQRATRVLQLLGVSHRGSVGTTTSAPSSAQQAAVPDLLGGLGDDSASASAAGTATRKPDDMELLGECKTRLITDNCTDSISNEPRKRVG